MKRIILTISAVMLTVVTSFAQEELSRDDYLRKYSQLVIRFGPTGVGVETVINNWEAAFPDDEEMLAARFTYHLAKSQTMEVKALDVDKYLGKNPVLNLQDSLGKTVNYFEVTTYDDEEFSLATKAIDKAISINPNRLDLRFIKTAALLGYEKDSPDMTLANLKGLADYNGHNHPVWEYPGVNVDNDYFTSAIQEYCVAFYRIGSNNSYEAFRSLSEKMLEYFPDNTLFLSNLGSYYLVYKKDDKSAQKYYSKVLKINPKDYTAIKNLTIMARNEKNVKLEKKYLALLAEVTENPTEKAQAEMRLKSL